MESVEAAFRWARIHATRHMGSCEDARLRWGETAITEIVMSRTAVAATVVPFTQRAEALSGSDWIWWWVDPMGAYGLLVQAKRVSISGNSWRFDFGYPSGTGRQHTSLLATAAALDLTPAYALYLGTARYRSWAPCPDGHRGGRCLQCVKRSVSLMPAILAEEALVVDAVATYVRSVALEDVWRPATGAPLLFPSLRVQLSTELADFLTTEQRGVRAVTRRMIDKVLAARSRQFEVVTAPASQAHYGGRHYRAGSVFRNLPSDTGHWGTRYFEQILQPLKQAPPAYVLEVESGDFDAEHFASNLPPGVAGIAVIHPPDGP